MEDPFFSAASVDLDKILDDFEESETPTVSDESQKLLEELQKLSLAFAGPNVSKEEKKTNFQAHTDLAAAGSAHPASDGDNLNRPTENEHVEETANLLGRKDIANNDNMKNSVTDLLIDFSAPDISVSSQPQQKQTSSDVLKDLEFLLPYVPASSKSNSSEVHVLPSASANNLDITSTMHNSFKNNKSEVAELHQVNGDVGEIATINDKDSNSTLSQSTSSKTDLISSNTEASCNLPESLQNETEILNLMEEELNALELPIDIKSGNKNAEEGLHEIKTAKHTDDLVDSPENADCLQKVLATANTGTLSCNIAPLPQDPSSSIIQSSSISNKETDAPRPDTTSDNSISSLPSNSTISVSVTEHQTATTSSLTSFPEVLRHEVTQNSQSVSSTNATCEDTNNFPGISTSQSFQSEQTPTDAIVVDVNHSNENQGISPPSYSSVIAGDYSAGTIIHEDPSMAFPSNSAGRFQQVVQPVRAPANEQYGEPIERGVEVTEETSTNILQGSQREVRPGSVPETSPAVLPTIIQRPGQVKPRWVPDEESPTCTKCKAKFTFRRRRHHCRACGRVFCSTCCAEKSKLAYLENAEARVCIDCYTSILQADSLQASQANQSNTSMLTTETLHAPSHSSQNSSPRPIVRNNEDSNGTPKSVRFSDGTKPDHPTVPPSTPPMPTRPSRGNRAKQRSGNGGASPRTLLPPVITSYSEDGRYSVEEDPDVELVLSLLDTGEEKPVVFTLSANLFVLLRLVQYGHTLCHYFISHGLDSVGQSEVALLLEVNSKSPRSIPIEAFSLYSHLFNSARKGKAVHANDFLLAADFLDSTDNLFGSAAYSGFIFVRRTCQSIENLTRKPNAESPFLTSASVNFSSTLFALLVRTSEVSWSNLFCSRLLLGLGAKYKQFPYPLMNIHDRPPVYFEVGSTILGILCDFRNYKYRVVAVPGLSVIVKKASVVISIPYNRFADLMKIMNSSNEHVLALGSDAFVSDDNCSSHLVCIQNQSNSSYHTEVITSQDEVDPAQLSAGAAFVVFNGSLKSGASQQAKCTVVEDGVMVQLLPEKMSVLKESLKAMEDFRVTCQPLSNALSETKLPTDSETDPQKSSSSSSCVPQEATCHSVEVRWIADDTKFNIGLSSPIDFCSLEGIVGYNVQGKSEKKGKGHVLRWNQVFFFKTPSDILDMSRLAERVANGFFHSLVPHVKLLRDGGQIKIGIRVNIHPDDVGYSVGSNGVPLPVDCMNSLDDHLISLLHEASSNLQAEDDPVVFELIFHILDIRSSWKSVQRKPSP